MKSKLVQSVLAATLFLGMSAPLLAESVSTSRVIVVQTDNLDGYLQELETGRAHMKRLGITSTLRIWKAKFAGPNAGNLVITIEFPSLAALAKDDEKMAADPAVQTWLKGLGKVRKIVSDSLYTEIKP